MKHLISNVNNQFYYIGEEDDKVAPIDVKKFTEYCVAFIDSLEIERLMKTITLTDDQFDTLFGFVNQKVESIVDASVDYNDSEILNEWEDLFDVHTVLETADNWS